MLSHSPAELVNCPMTTHLHEFLFQSKIIKHDTIKMQLSRYPFTRHSTQAGRDQRLEAGREDTAFAVASPKMACSEPIRLVLRPGRKQRGRREQWQQCSAQHRQWASGESHWWQRCCSWGWWWWWWQCCSSWRRWRQPLLQHSGRHSGWHYHWQPHWADPTGAGQLLPCPQSHLDSVKHPYGTQKQACKKDSAAGKPPHGTKISCSHQHKTS